LGRAPALPHGAEAAQAAVDVARDVLVHGLDEQRRGAVGVGEHDVDVIAHRAKSVNLDGVLGLGVGDAVEDGLASSFEGRRK
jgi:hypothetical protein